MQPDEQPKTEPQTPAPIQPAPMPLAAPDQRKKKGKLLIILLTILVVAVLVAVAWLAFKPSDEDGATPTQTQDTSQQIQEEAAGQETKTTTFVSGLAGASTATVTHPTGWEVAETSEGQEGGISLKHTAIGSPEGHWLHLYDVSGIGGACDPDEDSFTLQKKLPTATADVYFTEYKAEGIKQVLRIEDFGSEYVQESHKNMQEGESGTDLCTNQIGYYSSYGGVYVTLTDSKERPALSSTLSYENIASDTGFIEMLKSLKIVDNSTEE